MEHMLDFVRLSTRPVMYNERALVVITLLKLLEGSLAASVESNETYGADHYERVFLFCLAWSAGTGTSLSSMSRCSRPRADTSCSSRASARAS